MSRDWRTLTRVALKGALRWVGYLYCVGLVLDPEPQR